MLEGELDILEWSAEPWEPLSGLGGRLSNPGRDPADASDLEAAIRLETRLKGLSAYRAALLRVIERDPLCGRVPVA